MPNKTVLSKKITVIISYGVTVFLGLMALIIIYSSNLAALVIFSGIILVALFTAYWLKKIDMGF